MGEKVREADLGPFKGVSGRRLQERLACTMREKMKEARWKLRMNHLGEYSVGACNSD